MIYIQTVLTLPECKTTYWKKDGNNKAKRISKSEWFRLYKMENINVLPPITKEK